jgi:predicted RNase H-like nuclease
MKTFLGVDLGWYGKPSGLASIRLTSAGLQLHEVARIESAPEIFEWIRQQAGHGSSVIAVDAPLVIRNRKGIRPAERELNADFRRFHAGCHPANLGRPFAKYVIEFSRRLAKLGFEHGAAMKAKQKGRFQIEVHPHAATVQLFELPRIVKYKRGLRATRAAELNRLRKLMLMRLPLLNPPLTPTLPKLPQTGPLKPAEDQIDAAMCAYIAAHYWFWGAARNRVYGDNERGYVVIPGVPARFHR